MAELTKSVLGQVSGQLDNLVFRKMNGKSFVSVRPKKYNASKSALAKQGRSNFAMTVKFAKEVNSFPGLKEIWSISKAEGSNSFQKIIKNNAKLLAGGALTPINRITPGGSALKIISASVLNRVLNLSFTFPVNDNIKFPVTLYLFFFFKKDKKSVYAISEKISAPIVNNNYNLEISLKSEIKKSLIKDSHPVIYTAIAGGTTYKKKVYWTSTASIQI
jgi:hypothetical protein